MPDLVAVVGGAQARAVDRYPAGPEGDRRLLMAVALGPAIGVVPSLRTDDLIDLRGHQVVEHSESGATERATRPSLAAPASSPRAS